MGSGIFWLRSYPFSWQCGERKKKLSMEDAVAAVVRDNLFGLELDPACAQIAAFNLALSRGSLWGEPSLYRSSIWPAPASGGSKP